MCPPKLRLLLVVLDVDLVAELLPKLRVLFDVPKLRVLELGVENERLLLGARFTERLLFTLMFVTFTLLLLLKFESLRLPNVRLPEFEFLFVVRAGCEYVRVGCE